MQQFVQHITDGNGPSVTASSNHLLPGESWLIGLLAGCLVVNHLPPPPPRAVSVPVHVECDYENGSGVLPCTMTGLKVRVDVS